MKSNVQILINEINDYAENNKLFWVCAIAKDCLPVFKNHINQLHPVAQIAVNHYLNKYGIN